MSLYQTSSFDEALAAARADTKVCVLTRSEKGSVVAISTATYEVPAVPVSRVVDTTGAGDLYAAGFLYGYTHGKHLAECGRLGGIAAAEVISHVGARPEKALKDLA
jgi:sugar/nucleoside kinase (ribokinase family)